MKKFLVSLGIVFALIFFYFAGAAITDNYSEPDNKDHSFSNMIFVLAALVAFFAAIASFAVAAVRTKKV